MKFKTELNHTNLNLNYNYHLVTIDFKKKLNFHRENTATPKGEGQRGNASTEGRKGTLSPQGRKQGVILNVVTRQSSPTGDISKKNLHKKQNRLRSRENQKTSGRTTQKKKHFTPGSEIPVLPAADFQCELTDERRPQNVHT